MSHKKDTDYLAISSRIHAMENRMLTRERLNRMVDAREDSDALKVLSECGYGGNEGLRLSDVESALARARAETFSDIRKAVPDSRVVDVFQLRYDYHNAKVLVKARAMGMDAANLLMDGGRYDTKSLIEGDQKDDIRGVGDVFRMALKEAREVLDATHDPQQADLVLDRACYHEMGQLAKESGSAFLQGYVRLAVDVANLRTAVRVARMEKGKDFLSQVLLPEGNVSVHTLTNARTEDLVSLFQSGTLADAAELGVKVARPGAGSLTAFERECDNALTRYLNQARLTPFGEQTVIAYLYAREAELTAIRTVLAGRKAGLDGAVIRERLRESCV